jgi:hypothetical protein
MEVEIASRPVSFLRHFIAICMACLILPGLQSSLSAFDFPKPPAALEVLPVFFVPRGEGKPTPKERKLVTDHVKWTQDTYRKMLQGKSNFRIANREAPVIEGRRELETYRLLPESAAPEIVGEIFDHLKQDRFSTPYVFMIIMANRKNEFPLGGGRPINGGLNEGGGIIVLSQYAFNSLPNIQSTMRHEIGHAFGLLHVDAYRYDMASNDSIMSYNNKHHTNGFKDSPNPGILNPEDLRALALNDRGFPDLAFSAAKDVPADYSIFPRIPSFPPMRIEGHPDYLVRLTSDSPNEFASQLSNIVQKPILPNRGPEITYNPQYMWSTRPDATGWTTVHVKFPRPVSLDRITVHSEHSAQYHRVAVKGKLTELASEDVDSPEHEVKFEKTETQSLLMSFRPGRSGLIVLRGLQFFDGEQEWFRSFAQSL